MRLGQGVTFHEWIGIHRHPQYIARPTDGKPFELAVGPRSQGAFLALDPSIVQAPFRARVAECRDPTQIEMSSHICRKPQDDLGLVLAALRANGFRDGEGALRLAKQKPGE